jgi:hypothetical protein
MSGIKFETLCDINKDKNFILRVHSHDAVFFLFRLASINSAGIYLDRWNFMLYFGN